MKRSIMFSIIMSVVIFFLGNAAVSNGVSIDGLSKIEASSGLPQETASFSTVEVLDIDGDGKDEMILPGAGFLDGEIRTEGIRVYEYDILENEWAPFGSGLPGDGSGKYYGGLGIGDVNDDGNEDIVGPIPSRWYDIDTSENGLDIFTGDGSGGFSFLHTIPLMDSNLGSSNEVEVKDLDGDGFQDIVASTYSGVKVFFGDGSGTRWSENSPAAVRTVEISGIGIGDLDNDGLTDIVGTPGQGSSEVEVFIQGNLRTWRKVGFRETDAGFGVKVLDVDLDGNNDIIYGTRNEGIKVYLGEGAASLTAFPSTDASNGLPDDNGDWDQLEFADINGDELPDMIAAINSGSHVHCFINDLPDGWIETFTDDEGLFVGGDAYGANFGDWNGDGQMDIGAASWDHGADAWIIPREGSSRPIADSGRDRAVNIGDTVILDGSGSSDPDGTIVEWEWTCTSHDDVDITDADTSTASFIPEEEGTHIFSLMVKDNDDEWSIPSSVSIEVLDPSKNTIPIADAGTSMHVDVGQEVELDGSSSYDVDGDIISWQWTCTSHSSVVLQDDDTAFPFFTPDEEGTYLFDLVVTDDDGDISEPDQVSVEVSYKKFFPEVGPFLYEGGGMISGATITLSMDGEDHKAITDSEGYATFEMGLKAGTYVCTVAVNGEVIIDAFSLTITINGQPDYQGGSLPQAPSEDEASNNLILIILAGSIVGVLILVVVIFLLSRKRENVETAEYAVPPAVYSCETCGNELVYMQDFNMYHCRTCERYADQ